MNMNMRNLDLYVQERDEVGGFNIRDVISRNRQIIIGILQPNVVSNLRTCFESKLFD